MNKTKKGYVEVNSLQIHYKESGVGKPLLLLHEMPLSSTVFDSIIPILAEEIHVIALDIPGYGNSETSSDLKSIPGYARFIWSVMDEMGVKNLSVLGVHGGASIAIAMANQNPKRVEKLILTGVPLLTDAERLKLKNGLIKMQMKKEGTHFREWWNIFSNKWSSDTPIEIIHRAVTQVMSAGEDYEVGYRAAFDYDPSVGLTKLQLPVLLQVAEGDVLASKNIRAKELISSPCKEEVISVAGHLSQRLPERTASSILKFLKEDFAVI